MTHVRFAPEVPDELAAAVLWYEARRQGLGREFLDEVQATLPLVDERALVHFRGFRTWTRPSRSGGLARPLSVRLGHPAIDSRLSVLDVLVTESASEVRPRTEPELNQKAILAPVLGAPSC